MKPLIVALILLPTIAVAQETASQVGLDAWDKIFQVFSHPRCANCHVPADNRPRWSGPSYELNSAAGAYHGMNVNGGESRIGAETLPCGTCHQKHNSDLPHGPPGAEVWKLAPVEMVWWKQSSAQICQQVKDPKRNGDRTLADLAEHVEKDELVHWGWTPGPGREPAPYTIEQTVAALKMWAAEGAPCPLE